MRDRLEILGPSGERFLRPLEGERATVGKSPDCDVPIDGDPSVSKVHAVLERYAEGAWAIRDLGSRNGTFLNGERLLHEHRLRDRDEIRVGDTRLVFRAVSLDEPTAAASTGAPPSLTPRERDVLVELCRPMLLGQVFREPRTAREIAAALFVSEDAVKQHLRNLYGKFAIHDGESRRRVALANEALRRGAVGPSDIDPS